MRVCIGIGGTCGDFVSMCMLALGLVDLVWFRDDLHYGYLMFYLGFSVIVCDLLGFGCMAIVFAC